MLSLLVAWRWNAHTASSASMPSPSSTHGDQRAAGLLELDGDVARAGVERVLDQLLDHRGGPLDHLAGGDLVGDLGRQHAHAPAARAGGGARLAHTMSRVALLASHSSTSAARSSQPLRPARPKVNRRPSSAAG